MPAKICIYTVNIGDYDVLRQPIRRVPGADYYLVTDDPAQSLPGYKTIQVNVTINQGGIKTQRHYKIFPYLLLPGYDVYVYYDASYQIIGNLGDMISRFKGGFAVQPHPTRDCIYQEGQQIVKLGKASHKAVNEQLEEYAQLGIPPKFGLQATGIIIRDASKETKDLCAAWWAEVEKYTHRDQLGLPAAIFKTGIKPVYLRRWMLGGAFKQHQHKAKPVISTNKPKIWYFQPYATDMNVGRAYNEHCEVMGPDDWAVITDHDTMYIHPKTKAQIEHIIHNQGKDYDLLGCYTNRIGSPHQCYGGKRSDDYNALHHMEIAEKLHTEHYGEVEPIRQGIAGFFMAFPARTWQNHKFVENSIYFDTELSKAVLRAKGKIGLMKGVYIMHLYRPGSKDPQREYSHLKSTI